jgi:hypothetical protein
VPTLPPKPIQDALRAAAAAHEVPLTLLEAIAFVESSFDPKAVGPQTRAGRAIGLMQLLPAVVQTLAIKDPFDPVQSADGAARMLHELALLTNDDVDRMLASYVWGWANVRDRKPFPSAVLDYLRRVKAARKYYQDLAAVSGSGKREQLNNAIDRMLALNPNWKRAQELSRIWHKFNDTLDPSVSFVLGPHWDAYSKAFDLAPITDETTPPPWKIDPDLWVQASDDIDATVARYGKALEGFEEKFIEVGWFALAVLVMLGLRKR